MKMRPTENKGDINVDLINDVKQLSKLGHEKEIVIFLFDIIFFYYIICLRII